MSSSPPVPMTAHPGNILEGDISVPGDKSISHRAIILGSLAVGRTSVTGLLEAEDVMTTIQAARAFGAEVERSGGGWEIHGFGTGGFSQPDDVIDCGNSGTGVRLLMGAMSTSPVTAVFTGDHSLRSRPMGRVLEPISEFGACFTARDRQYLPVTIVGASDPVPVDIELAVPSAQVKSALMLGGLNAPGVTRLVERANTRDHTENMLRSFGAEIDVEEFEHGRRISVGGYAELQPQPVIVPGDPSSAAFPVVSALITGGSRVRLDGVCVNPTRTGLYTTLIEMGARLEFANRRIECGEPVADLLAEFSGLQGVEVPPERAPTMIDEYPVLAVAAAFAEGRTVMHGIEEMRYKECDRLSVMARGLEACGVHVEETRDSLAVTGRGDGSVAGGATCEAHFDHRIAMSFLCLGLAARNPVTVDDTTVIATSFPEFVATMTSLGAEFG